MTKNENAASSTEVSPDPRYLAMLSLGALGVVFGDIGTSPLYAFRETFASTPELGVTQANVDEMMTSDNQSVQRLLGKDGTFGEDIGLTTAWAADVLKAVGNYGEIFERNIGADSPLQIARGLNALWTKGGIQYAPPIR